MEWRHIPSGKNPTDLTRREGLATKENTLWSKGPMWLTDPLHWPLRIVTKMSLEVTTETKPMKQVHWLKKKMMRWIAFSSDRPYGRSSL